MSWKLPEAARSLRGPATASIAPGGFDLSFRLFDLLRALPRRPRILDVGADHGLLALSALRLGIASEALAIDRREGPLSGAAARMFLEKGDDYRFVLSDGLESVETTRDDMVVIAGMSGENAASILRATLSRGVSLPSLWAFQVNEGHRALRETLFNAGFCALSEWFVAEPKRFFLNQIWIHIGVTQCYSEHDCELGPLTLGGRSPLMQIWTGLEGTRLARDLEGLRNARDFDSKCSRYQAIAKRYRLLADQSLEIPAHTE